MILTDNSTSTRSKVTQLVEKDKSMRMSHGSMKAKTVVKSSTTNPQRSVSKGFSLKLYFKE